MTCVRDRILLGTMLALASWRCGPLLDPTGSSSANRAPEIRSVTVTPEVVPVAGSATIVVTAIDPDGERIFYHFAAGAGTISVPDAARPQQAVYVHSGGPSASDLIVVTVTDPRNASATSSREVRLRINTAPVVTLRSRGSCHPPCTATFTADVFDSEDDTLTYAWGGCASGTQRSSTCAITAPAAVSAIVTVSDGRGGTTTVFADEEGTNEAPVVSGGASVRGVPARLRVTRSDPDDDETQCGWTGDCQCTGSQTNFDLDCDVPAAAGACTMIFRCFDPFGASGETTFHVGR